MGWNIELVESVAEMNVSDSLHTIENAIEMELDNLSWRENQEIVFRLAKGIRNLQKHPDNYTSTGNIELALKDLTYLLDIHLEQPNIMMNIKDSIVKLTYIIENIGNYTYNVSPMYRKAMNMSLSDFHGMNAKDAIMILENGIKEMECNGDEYEKLNPENGWGDYKGALNYIKRLLDSCRENPDAIIYVG